MGRRKEDKGLSIDEIVLLRKQKYGQSYGELKPIDEVKQENKEKRIMKQIIRSYKNKSKELMRKEKRKIKHRKLRRDPIEVLHESIRDNDKVLGGLA